MPNNTTSSTLSENIVVVYSKQTLDQVVKLLDNLEFKGRTVHNAKIVTAVVQMLETQGTAQTIQGPAATSQDNAANKQDTEVVRNEEVLNEG